MTLAPAFPGYTRSIICSRNTRADKEYVLSFPPGAREPSSSFGPEDLTHSYTRPFFPTPMAVIHSKERILLGRKTGSSSPIYSACFRSAI